MPRFLENSTIHNIDELETVFRADTGIKVYVSTKIKHDWQVANKTMSIDGHIYNVFFKSAGGGVWIANCQKK